MSVLGYPRGVSDPLCPEGHKIAESTDRRLLWHLEGELAVSAPRQHEQAQQLRAYLDATCAHHWHGYAAGESIPAHVQCLWCSAVVWAGAP